MDKPRCQSCGMPLGTPGFYGTKTDGSEETDYCRFCYQQGNFTEPDLTLEGMITRSVDYMASSLKYTKKDAEKMSRDVIPGLKRWQ